jgi:hypothetical protein
MLRNAAAVLAVVLCLANTNATRAEPGPVVNWLMNEPASLFDIGMLQLTTTVWGWSDRKEIKQMSAQLGGTIWFAPMYQFDENRIYVAASVSDAVGIDGAQRKAICKNLIEFMSRMALVDSVTGKPMMGFEHSGFSSEFAHLAYRSTSEPENYRVRLDRIFVLKAIINESPQTTCRRDLLSNKVYFEE